MGFGLLQPTDPCQARASPDARAALMNSVRAGDFIAASEEEVGVEFWGLTQLAIVRTRMTCGCLYIYIYLEPN